MTNALAALKLPNAVEVQTLKLLHQIELAHTADDLFRTSDRAEGFVLGLETVKVLNAASIEGLYKIFEAAARRQSTSSDRRKYSRRGVARPGRTTRGVRMPGGQDQRRPRLGPVDSPGRQRRTLGAGALAT